jgi:dTDP-L-rhamnose 4-epimerase
MRVLVTGGAGFIGSVVVDRLLDAGHEVVVVDNLLAAAHREKPDHLDDRAYHHWVDIRDPEAMHRATRGVDAVCHQAAMVGLGVDFADAPAYASHNDVGTATLLASLHERRFTGRIVLASSMVVYGEGGYECLVHGRVPPLPRSDADVVANQFEPRCPRCHSPLRSVAVTEDAILLPRNVYAATKLHQEHLCAAYAIEHDASVIALRYHNVYGPRMPNDTPYAGVASIFRSAVEQGQAPIVFEDGGQRRDFIHVDDVARANVLALGAEPEVGGAFNVASGDPHTVLDLARALGGAAPDGRPIEPVIVGGARRGDVRHVVASPAAAERVLGFRAATTFEDGVADFVTAPLRT